MIVRRLLLAALLVAVAAPAARADSWLPPRAVLASSLDGRWYVILTPRDTWQQADFQLVKRADGAAPRPGTSPERTGRDEPKAIPVEKGDTVVARGVCQVPMEVRCLDGGKGFVLFETYANVGYHTAVEVRDGQGKSRWTKTLRDFFSAKQIDDFVASVSSIWWHEAVWVDEEAGDLVVLYKPSSGTRVLRVSLADGKHREGSAQDVVARLGRGHADEQIAALGAAEKLKVPGLLTHVQTAFGRAGVPLAARLRFAVFMQARGDATGQDLVVATAQPGQPDDVRAYAVTHLATFLGEKSYPILRDALKSEDRGVWSGAEAAFRGQGAAAVPTLIEIVRDVKARERQRLGAVHALWNMGAPAKPALGALDEAARSASKRLADAAANAANSIRKSKPGR